MERNLEPNPIRSGHYGEMSRGGSDGGREILGEKEGGRWGRMEGGEEDVDGELGERKAWLERERYA